MQTKYTHELETHGNGDIDGMGEIMVNNIVENVPSDAQRVAVSDVKAEGNGSGKGTDWDKLFKPSSLIKRFEPSPKKIMTVARHLMDNKYSMSDEYRDYGIIYGILDKYIRSPNCIFYEVGDMDGVLGFTDIIVGWKCHAIFELLNPRIWGKKLVKESRYLFDLVMDTGKLVKISSQTADDRVRRMGEMIGFTVEGIRVAEFSWDDELYNIYLLGRIK